jgi:hypothetical protein
MNIKAAKKLLREEIWNKLNKSKVAVSTSKLGQRALFSVFLCLLLLHLIK